MREPCVIRWPAVIPAGTTCSELAATIDIVPTVAEIIGAELPQHKIDGKSVLPLLKGDPQAKSPHEAYFYFYNRGLRAVRSGQWKLVFPHSYRSLNGPAGTDGRPSQYKQLQCGLELYHLKKDIGESLDVAGENPEVVKRLQSLADGIRRELGDQLRNQKGSQNRNPGKI